MITLEEVLRDGAELKNKFHDRVLKFNNGDDRYEIDFETRYFIKSYETVIEAMTDFEMENNEKTNKTDNVEYELMKKRMAAIEFFAAKVKSGEISIEVGLLTVSYLGQSKFE